MWVQGGVSVRDHNIHDVGYVIVEGLDRPDNAARPEELVGKRHRRQPYEDDGSRRACFRQTFLEIFSNGTQTVIT